MTEQQGLNLHIYPAPIVSESRIFRQTRAIEQAGLFDRVEICGTTSPELPEVERLSANRLIRRVGSGTKGNGSVLGRVLHQVRWSRDVYSTYANASLAAIHAHSVAVLPVAASLARRTGARLIYDTHELETKSATSGGIQGRIFSRIERTLIRRCDVVFVVNDLIRSWYLDAYPGLSVFSIVNTPLGDDVGHAIDLRSAFDVPADSRLYVHVGNVGAARHIPELIKLFSKRPSDHIVFLGDGPLRTLVQDAGKEHQNIHWHPNIDSRSVVPTIGTADVGICLIQPSCLSYALSLPNKAIEYSAARIPFVRNDLPAVERMLDGRLAKFRVESISEGLAGLLDSISPTDISEGRVELSDVPLPTWPQEAGRMLEAIRSVLDRERGLRNRSWKGAA